MCHVPGLVNMMLEEDNINIGIATKEQIDDATKAT
jgi:hypothetical protein